MSSARSARGLCAVVAAAALATWGVLAFEARRPSPPKLWFELSAGLGLGSQAGVDAGWFGYDARLESAADKSFDTPPGAALAGGQGVFTLAPMAR